MKASRRWAAVAVTFVAMGGIDSAVSARPADLSWEDAFPIDHAKSEVHLDAHFVGSDGLPHRLQLWRRGRERLHRRTDDALDLYLEKADGQADYRYRLVDHRRKLSIDVNRVHLYRIGVFSDWFGLAHVLDRPKTAFSVRTVAALAGERRPDCVWRLLVRETPKGADRSRICWSSAWGVPLVIRTASRDGGWIDRLVVDSVDGEPIAAGTVDLPARPPGYASFDAGKEIAPEAGD